MRGWELESEGGGPIEGGELVSECAGVRLWRFSAGWEAERILSALHEAGGRPRLLSPQRETLEDLFLRTLSGEEDAPR